MPKSPDDIWVFERVAKSDQEHGFKDVTDQDRLFDTPTVLCLGPVDCFHGDPITANGFAKSVQRIISRIGVYDDELRILSITHPYDHDVPEIVNDYNGEMLSDVDREQTIAWDAVKRFVDSKFRYLFYDGDQLRDIDQIKRNCRRVNIVTHSLGGVLIQQMGNVIAEILKNEGLSAYQIADITSQFFVLTTGNVASLKLGRASFTQIHVYGLGDRISYARCAENHDDILVAVRTRNLVGKNLAVFPLNERTLANNYVVCIGDIIKTDKQRSEMGYRNIEPVIDPDMPRVDLRSGRPQINYNDLRRTEHGVTSYMFYGIGTHGLMVPLSIGTAMTNALLNSVYNHSNDKFIPLAKPAQLLIAPAISAFSELADEARAAIEARVLERFPPRGHTTWEEQILDKRDEAREEIAAREIVPIARSDPKSEKAYARLEVIAASIGYNERILDAMGRSNGISQGVH